MLGLSPVLADLMHVPVPLVAAIGLGTVAWAWLLARFARGREWLEPLKLVAAANAIASLGVAALALLAPELLGRLLLTAVAVEVAAFAVVQARLARFAGRVGEPR